MKKKGKNRLFANLPVCAVDFISQIIKKMRYRKKVRRDVMAELIAHFEDALKECATDKEKEQKAGELIEQFGDVKLLGILLRRAKKRCRPLWRTVIARSFQTVGVLILCLIVYLAWFLTGKPNITVDYVAELNKLVRPAADDSLNAAPLYGQAAKTYEELSEDVSQILGKKYDDTNDAEKQFMQKWLAENEEIFELVIAGSKKPYYWQKYNNGKEEYGMLGILLPHLSRFKRLAYPLRWRAQLQAEQGLYEDAFNGMKTCYRFGQHIRGSKIIIEQLSGIAIEAFAVRTIRDILSEYEVDSATLAALQKDFEGLIADEDFALSLEVEKLIMYDEAQRCFTEGRLGGGHLYMPRAIALGRAGGGILEKMDNPVFVILSPQQWRGVAKVLFLHPNKQQTREMADQLYSYWNTVANKSPGQIRVEDIDIEKESMEIIRGNILLEILIPAIGKMIEISCRLPADVNATLTIIALLRYRQDAGSYPEELDGLITAGYLKESPMDPFSDKPLVYRRTEDGFVLYSVGADFDDDGGIHSRWGEGEEGGDQVFWPIQDN